MVFMGRGRGRGVSQYGAISATTRKEKRPAENYERTDRDRSRSPVAKRPVLERLGPQREEPSHESLRITVGNDIFKERQSRSPLSDRLGPPVKKQDSYDDMKYHSDERYDQLYGGLSDDERDARKSHNRRDRYDSPHSPIRASRERGRRAGSHDRRSDSYDRGRKSDSYDRGRRSDSYDRGRRSDSYDRGRRSGSYDRGKRSGSYDRGRRSDSFDRGKRSDSYDREGKSRSYDQNQRSTSRDRERRDYSNVRHDSHDHYSDNDKRDHVVREKRDNNDDHHHGGPYEKQHHSDRDIGDLGRNVKAEHEQIHRYRIPEPQPVHSYPEMYPSPDTYGGTAPLQSRTLESGDNKPLKSILKKSAPDPPIYTSDNQSPVQHDASSNLYRAHKPELHRTLKAEGNIKKKSFSGLPGMSSYMDIEDEERFLYGEDEKEKSPQYSKEYSSYKKEDRTSPRASYPGGYQADERYPAHQQQSDYTSYNDQRTSQPQPRRDSNPDLLSIFTSQRGPTNSTVTPPYAAQHQPQQNPSPTDSKAKYDPTIENILKSIGFDFEMSKRMQEKANPTPIKPKEEIQYGIDQASSFLGGELSEDIKKEIFPTKSRKESMVDILLREAKMTTSKPDNSKAQHQDSLPLRERRDSIPRRDPPRRDRSFERESSYRDDVRDKPAPIPSKSLPVASSQPISPTYTTPSSSYASTDTFSISTIQPKYGAATTTSSTYPTSSSYPVSGFASFAPPPAPYAGPPPFGMPPPGHPSMWGPPPGHPAYAARFAAPRMYAPSPGYPPGYPPYGTPRSYKESSSSSSTKVTNDIPKVKESVTKTKNSNLKLVELEKKSENSLPKKSETKTVTVIKKVKKIEKGKSKGNVVSSTATSSNRTVIPPKVKPSVKSPPVSKPTAKEQKEKLVISKVILTSREKEILRREKEQHYQRVKILEQELASLRKQQNELMRKRRRQKDGHKDPILMQNSILQEEITKQISKLRQEAEEKSKLINEASIDDGGASTPKRSRESSSSRQSPMVSESPAKKPRTETKSMNHGRSFEKSKGETAKRKDDIRLKDDKKSEDRRPSSSSRQSTEKAKETPKVEPQKSKIPGTPKPNKNDKDTFKPIKPVRKVKYEFFDPGNHWCKNCNVVCSSLTSMLQHLHGKKHQSLVNKYDRPWMPEELKSGTVNEKSSSNDEVKVEITPIKGQEFFMATRGYYCTLCKEHTGDDLSAEHHIKQESHFLKYQDYLKEKPFYEQRLNLDKAAGMSLMKDEEKKQEKKEVVKPQTPKPDEKTKEKEAAQEAKRLEQKKKMQAIWDQHIKSKQQAKQQDKQAQNKNTQAQNKNTQGEEEKEKEKGKIQINILNKGGIKQKQAPPPVKKTPVLPPWTPVSKEQKVQAKVEPARKPSVDYQEPPSLDDFITFGQNQKIPVVSEASKNIKLITADTLMQRVSAKKAVVLASEKVNEKKDIEMVEEKRDLEKVEEKNEVKNVEENIEANSEEKKDLEMLALNTDDLKPMADDELPPPPTQNLLLPTENKDKMATSSSDEMYTLTYSDDKQVIISTDDKPTIETKADDLVEIDAEANVTLLSEDEEEKEAIPKDRGQDKEPVPMDQATASDIVVISLDSPEVESSDNDNEVEDNTAKKEKVESREVEGVDKANEVSEKVDREVVGQKVDQQEGVKDKLESIDDKNEKDIEEKPLDIDIEEKPLDIDVEEKPLDIQATSVNVDLTQENTLDEASVPPTKDETSSKIEVLTVSQKVPIKERRKTRRSVGKNVTEVAIIDDQDESPIEVVGVQPKSGITIQVIQTRRSEQAQAQKTSPTSLRTRELSNLHDVVNIDVEMDTTEKEKLSPKKKKRKIAEKSGPAKKRTTRASSAKSKAKIKAQPKYVPKRHPQVDIVSISDDEDKYENVDSASDFSADEQELENISSSSEKFDTDINEHLENVSSDSEIEDNEKNTELENISSDEMEGNIMTVDEVGEVDDFDDFDFNDEENVLDQVGDSDDETESKEKTKSPGMEEMELENISDAEDGDFKKCEVENISDAEEGDFKKCDDEDMDLDPDQKDKPSKSDVKEVEGKKEDNKLDLDSEQINISAKSDVEKDTCNDISKTSENNVEKEVTEVTEEGEKDMLDKEITGNDRISPKESENADAGDKQTNLDENLPVDKTLETENVEQESQSPVKAPLEEKVDNGVNLDKKQVQVTETDKEVKEIGVEKIEQLTKVNSPINNTIIEITEEEKMEETTNAESSVNNTDIEISEDQKVEQTTDTQSSVQSEFLNELPSKEISSQVTGVSDVSVHENEDVNKLDTGFVEDGIKHGFDEHIQSSTGEESGKVTSDDISEMQAETIGDISQKEDSKNVKPTRGRKRGRGRGRGATRATPRRGRSSAKLQTENEGLNEEGEDMETENVNISIEIENTKICEGVSNEQKDTIKSSTEEESEVNDNESKIKTPRRGRPKKKKENESKPEESVCEEESETNKLDELKIANETEKTEVKECQSQDEAQTVNDVQDTLNSRKVQETYDNVKMQSDKKCTEMPSSKLEDVVVHEIQNDKEEPKIVVRTEKQDTQSNIDTCDNQIDTEIQATLNDDRDSEKLQTEEKPEVINLDSEDEIIKECENKKPGDDEAINKQLLEGNSIVEDKMEVVQEARKEDEKNEISELDLSQVVQADSQQTNEGLESTSEKTNIENIILIADENDQKTSEELLMETTEDLNEDESDILPLDIDFTNLDSYNESAENNEEDEVEILDSEKQLKIDTPKVAMLSEDENIKSEKDASSIENFEGDIISISDDETEVKNDNEEIQSQKTVCMELDKDTLETFNLSMQPELSVSLDPTFESNKTSNATDLIDLDINNLDHLPLFQDDAASNSDNASSTSEIKIDVVLEAIDSLSGVDTSGDNVSASVTKTEEIVDDEKSMGTVDVTENVMEVPDQDVETKDEENGEYITIENSGENSRDEEDMIVLSSALDNGSQNESQNLENVDDAASEASGVSMDMGSDFEVLDECESD